MKIYTVNFQVVKHEKIVGSDSEEEVKRIAGYRKAVTQVVAIVESQDDVAAAVKNSLKLDKDEVVELLDMQQHFPGAKVVLKPAAPAPAPVAPAK